LAGVPDSLSARQRVRGYLLEGKADRRPFLPMATEFTATLAQRSVEELLADPHLFMQSFMESVAVCGFEALLIAVPPQALGAPGAGQAELGALKEGLARLRTMAGDRLGLIPLLPGPWTLSASAGRGPGVDEVEDSVTDLLAAFEQLHPAGPDAVAILEQDAMDGLDDRTLGEHAAALTTLWNVARYYSLAGFLVASSGDARLAGSGADAVTVWAGATAGELLARGAPRAGVPITPGSPGPLEPCPPGGFYTTAGEIPSNTAVSDVKDLVAQAKEALRPG
jgi:hypothetical protein